MDTSSSRRTTVRIGDRHFENTSVDLQALLGNIVEMMAASGGDFSEMMATVDCLRNAGAGTMDVHGFRQMISILARLVSCAEHCRRSVFAGKR